MEEDFKIIVDTREKLKLWTDNIILKKIDAGDYSFSFKEKDYSNIIAIERKTMADIVSTISSGHARFKRELERSRELDYFAIIIEGSHQQIQNKRYKGSKFSLMKGETINKILTTLQVKYGINILFAGNKENAKIMIKNTFVSYLHKIGEKIK